MSMPTLYVLPRPTPADAPKAERVIAQLAPFCAQGIFDGGELHAATTLARQVGEWDPCVILLAALTLRAPAHGHICFDLMDYDPWPTPDRRDLMALPPLVWPSQIEAQRRLAASPLVASLVDDFGLYQPVAVSHTAFVFDGKRLYTQRNWNLQIELAEALRTRLSAPALGPAQADVLRRGLLHLFDSTAEGQPLDRQRLACALAAMRPLTVLTGGPGTGKTFTVLRLLALAFAVDLRERRLRPDKPALRVALAAPTGKAAARVRESLAAGLSDAFCARYDLAFAEESSECAATAAPPSSAFRAFVEQLVPRTLHKVLGTRPGAVFSVKHDAATPLPWDLVVVDETSMVDFELFARLVRALSPATRVILLGDRHQLASVEAGSVLADLCGEQSSGSVALSQAMYAALRALLPPGGLGAPGEVSIDAGHGAQGLVEGDSIVALTQSRRFNAGSRLGAFVVACVGPAFNADRALAALEGWIHEPPEDLDAPYAALVAHAVRGYQPLKEALEAPRPEAPHGVSPTNTAAVTEAVHHRLALDALNTYRVLCAQRGGAMGVEAVNRAITAAWTRGASSFGNQAFGARTDGFWVGRPILVTRNDATTGLANGDVGLVVTRRDAEGGESVVVAFPGPDAMPSGDARFSPDLRLVVYVSPARLPPHETTFAMTIHKSQGSEFDRIAVAIGDHSGRLLSRELVYTGITRARTEATLFVRTPVLRYALNKQVKRASGLGPLLRSD